MLAKKNVQSKNRTKNNWYLKTYFNLLGGMNDERAVPLFKAIKPGAIVIGSKHHHGWLHFFSSTGGHHPEMKEDQVAKWAGLVRKTGSRLVITYSGLNDARVGKLNPTWRRYEKNGKPAEVSGEGNNAMCSMCPNSPYVEKIVLVHLRELIKRFRPDGFWMDGDWAVICYCPRCRQAFKRKYGRPYQPTAGGRVESSMDPRLLGLLHQEDQSQVAQELEDYRYREVFIESIEKYYRKCSELVHKLKPDCLYCVNYAYSNSWMRSAEDMVDWLSLDMAVPPNPRRMQSVHARFLTQQDKPFDIMTADRAYPIKNPEMKSRPRMLEQNLQEGAVVLANGGRWFVWTEGGPYALRLLKKCADFARERKPFSLDTQPLRWTAVMESEFCRHNASCGAVTAMLQLHYSPDLINDDMFLKHWQEYQLLVVPEQMALSETVVETLRKFVARGGILVSTGSTILSPGMTEMLGLRVEKRNAFAAGAMKYEDALVELSCPWDRVKLAGAAVWQPLFKPGNEWQPESADMPAVTAHAYGKGLAVHVAGDIFWAYDKDRYPLIREIIGTILKRALPERLFATDAPPTVEVVLRRKGGDVLVHLCNLTKGTDLSPESKCCYSEDVPVIGPVCCELETAHKPKKVILEPGGKALAYKFSNGKTRIIVPRLHIHCCVRINYTSFI